MSSGIALLPIGPGHRAASIDIPRPRTAPNPPNLQAPRPQLPKINLDAIQRSPGRRVAGLALQARDSVSVRKRTLSTGAVSGRAARAMAKKAAAEAKDETPSTRTDSHPNRSPATQTDSHPNHRSVSPSSSSTTSANPADVSAAPSSYDTRAHTQTHVAQNSQGTNTSAYPPSSPSSRSSTTSSPPISRGSTPLPRKSSSTPITPHTPALDLDPNDVNARLRLLVNNSYFLPPAHLKPELSPIYLAPHKSNSASTSSSSRPLSPGAFKEFFGRVARGKKDKKTSEASRPNTAGSGVPGAGTHPISPPEAAHDYFDIPLPSPTPSRNRVVVVRETLDDLPVPFRPPPLLPRAPHRSSSVPNHLNHGLPGQKSLFSHLAFIDPTTQTDVPPPTHYPSFQCLKLDAAGLGDGGGSFHLDQFAPPGSPWSPTPSTPGGISARGMGPEEEGWRRAILEQAVDLSLSEGGRSPKTTGGTGMEMVFATRMSVSSNGASEEVGGGSGSGSGSGSIGKKKGWWSRGKDKEKAEKVESPLEETRSFGAAGPVMQIFQGLEAASPTSSLSAPNQTNSKRIGQSILPGLYNSDFDINEAQREYRAQGRERGMSIESRRSRNTGVMIIEKEKPSLPLEIEKISPHPSTNTLTSNHTTPSSSSSTAPPLPLKSPLRLKPTPIPFDAPLNAPSSLYALNSEPDSPVTPLRPRPGPFRRGSTKSNKNTGGMSGVDEEVFMPGHSTIKRSLSSPLLSDLHEVGVDVDVVSLRDVERDGGEDMDMGDTMVGAGVHGKGDGDEKSLDISITGKKGRRIQHKRTRSNDLATLRHSKDSSSTTSAQDHPSAPSLLLHDPDGILSAPSESFHTASLTYSDADSTSDFYTGPDHLHHHHHDVLEHERWSFNHSRMSHDVDGDEDGMSFESARTRPGRASSTFGVRHSNVSVVGAGSPLSSGFGHAHGSVSSRPGSGSVVGGGAGGGFGATAGFMMGPLGFGGFGAGAGRGSVGRSDVGRDGEGTGMGIEVDISGDPMDHLGMMRKGAGGDGESIGEGSEEEDSAGEENEERERDIEEGNLSGSGGYASALDRSFGGPSRSVSERPSSPSHHSFLSTRTRLLSVSSASGSTAPPVPPLPHAQISSPIQPRRTPHDDPLAPISFFDSVQTQAYLEEEMTTDGSESEEDEDEGGNGEPQDGREEAPYQPRTSLSAASHPIPISSARSPLPSLSTPPSAFSYAGPLTSHPNGSHNSLHKLSSSPTASKLNLGLGNASSSPISPGMNILSQLKSSKGFAPIPTGRKSRDGGAGGGISGGIGSYSTTSLVSNQNSGSDAGHAFYTPYTSTHPTHTFSGPNSQSVESHQVSLASASASISPTTSGVKDEAVKKLDGMLMQHLEAEKNRMRRIAVAAREKGGVDRVPE